MRRGKEDEIERAEIPKVAPLKGRRYSENSVQKRGQRKCALCKLIRGGRTGKRRRRNNLRKNEIENQKYEQKLRNG